MFQKIRFFGFLGLALVIVACQGKKDDTAETPAPVASPTSIQTQVVGVESTSGLLQSSWCLLPSQNLNHLRNYELRLNFQANHRVEYIYFEMGAYGRRGAIRERGEGHWQAHGATLTWTFPNRRETNGYRLERNHQTGHAQLTLMPQSGYPVTYISCH